MVRVGGTQTIGRDLRQPPQLGPNETVISRAYSSEGDAHEQTIHRKQIVAILHELDAGSSAKELGRRHGVHPNTIGAWKAKNHGMKASDVVRIRQLGDENARLKRVVANQTLEIDAVRDLLAKNFPGPQRAKKR